MNITMHKSIGNPWQRSGAYWYLIVICLFLVLRLFFWFSPSHADKINMVYLWPLAIAAAVLMVAQRLLPLKWQYVLPPLMAGWLLFSCVVNGDAYLIYNRTFILGIFLSNISFFLVIPSLPAENRERGLRGLAALYCGLMLIIAILGCSVAFTGRSFTTVLSDESIHVSQNRLFFFRYHPNEAGSALVVALYLALYLFAVWRKALVRILLVLAGGILLLPIALTGSRTAILLACAGIGIFIFWAIYAYAFRSRIWLRWLVGLAAVAAVVVGMYIGLNASVDLIAGAAQQRSVQSTAEPAAAPEGATAAASDAETAQQTDQVLKAISSRVQLEDIGTFNMRVGIWKSGLNYLKAHPLTYLFGVPDHRVARIPQEVGRSEMHMHNAYLEMLLLGGIPGLILYALYLLLLVYSGHRLAFYRESSWGRRFLAVIPLLLAVNGVTEIYPMFSGNVMDMMYFAVSGAVIAFSMELPPRRIPKG